MLQCAAIQFQFQLREEEEEVVVVVVVVVVQGAELGCLLRRLMVQASAEYKKRRADSAVFFIPAAKWGQPFSRPACTGRAPSLSIRTWGLIPSK